MGTRPHQFKSIVLAPHLGVGAESHCCRSQWSSSSSWTHFGSCSRRPGPSSQRATGRTWPSPPSRQSTLQSSSRRRLRSSHRCGLHTAGTHTSDLKHIALLRMVKLCSSQTLSGRHALVHWFVTWLRGKRTLDNQFHSQTVMASGL